MAQHVSTGNLPTLSAEFNGTPITITERDGHKWLTADQVGVALGYSEGETRTSVNKLYSRHQDEFTELDTTVVKLTTVDGKLRDVRIFSATGCIKLGFFANTGRAKKFRAWASEVLASQAKAPSADAELASLRTQVAQLQSAALQANPKWAAVARYRALGLTRAETAKLMDCSANVVEHTIANIKAAGITLAAPAAPYRGSIGRERAERLATSAPAAQAALFEGA